MSAGLLANQSSVKIKLQLVKDDFLTHLEHNCIARKECFQNNIVVKSDK
jgi:hypothetical protein